MVEKKYINEYRESYFSVEALNSHLSSEHHLKVCEICAKSNRMYPHELKLYGQAVRICFSNSWDYRHIMHILMEYQLIQLYLNIFIVILVKRFVMIIVSIWNIVVKNMFIVFFVVWIIQRMYSSISLSHNSFLQMKVLCMLIMINNIILVICVIINLLAKQC